MISWFRAELDCNSNSTQNEMNMTTSNSKASLGGPGLSRRLFLFLPLFIAAIALFIAAFSPAGAAGTEMGAKPNVLTLSEFLKLRGQQKGPVIIYLNEQQWENLTRGLKPGDGQPPRTGARMMLTTLPGLTGGFVEARCPVGEPRMGAEGELRCGQGPGVEFDDDKERTFCLMRMEQNGVVSCQGECKEHVGSCSKQSYGVRVGPGERFSVLMVLCQC